MSITVFCKLILSLLMSAARQYLKKELSYEVDVLHDDKHERFPMFQIGPTFSHLGPFPSLNLESIPSFFLTCLVVCVI